MQSTGSNVLAFALRAGALHRRNAVRNQWTALTRCSRITWQTGRYASSKSALPRAHKLAVPSRQGTPTVRKATPSPLANMVDGHWNPLAKKLASRSSPSILYESPSKGFYVVSCYGVGLFCLAWGAWNTYDTFIAVPFQGVELSDRVRVAMGITCVFMAGAALFFFSRPFHVVHSIKAIPYSLPNGQRSLQLEMQSGNVRQRSFLVSVGDMTASARLYVPGTNVSSAELAAQSQRRWEKDKQRILTLPFRQMYRGFRSFQNLIFGDDWIRLYVKGHSFSYKIDKTAAWALEDGKAFDTLVKQYV